MITHRDSIADRIGNTLRTMGWIAGVVPSALALGWWLRGDLPFFTGAFEMDAVAIFTFSMVAWVAFDKLDYLVTGRK